MPDSDDLFPNLDKEKFRAELREIYDKAQERTKKRANRGAKKKGNDEDEGGASVREPRTPNPSDDSDSIEKELVP